MRVARATTLDTMTRDFIEAAHAVGNPPLRIALRHVALNIAARVMVQASLSIATAIIVEASLSFLGLSRQPPTPSWGSMLNAAQQFLTQAPWLVTLSIILVVFGLNLTGDALHEALDRQRR